MGCDISVDGNGIDGMGRVAFVRALRESEDESVKELEVQTRYSWITHQMDIGTTLAFLLSRSDFKSETSFGFPSPNYTGQST